MIVKWRTTNYMRTIITRVECDRETDQSVWINGRRQQKETDYHSYFNAWEEARDFLRRTEERAIKMLERNIAEQRRTLAEIEALTKPEEV